MSIISPFLVLALLIVAAALWLWAVIDIVRTQFASPNTKILMVFLVLFFPIAGPIVYFFIRGNFLREEGPRFNPKFNRRD